jgi:hypothetical protein
MKRWVVIAEGAAPTVVVLGILAADRLARPPALVFD